MSCCAFLWAKRFKAKYINKEMFPVYCGKCLSLKALHSCVEKRSKCFADDDVVETEVRKWLRQQPRLLCWRFRRTVNEMGQVYQCWWRIWREINVFSRFKYHNVLCFISICGPFTDSPSHELNYCMLFKGNSIFKLILKFHGRYCDTDIHVYCIIGMSTSISIFITISYSLCGY
jgi:hypothetical protein